MLGIVPKASSAAIIKSRSWAGEMVPRFPAPKWRLTPICNSSSKGLTPFSDLCRQAPDSHTVHIYVETDTHRIKINKCF